MPTSNLQSELPQGARRSLFERNNCDENLKHLRVQADISRGFTPICQFEDAEGWLVQPKTRDQLQSVAGRASGDLTGEPAMHFANLSS